ncbi:MULTISPECIES: GNAT family N-acetyltransferase [unclassified Paenibacillus]|uniref:GNAT family N-acetyltransferase n=1 Tax=unclassified Paenibacillus TaxID=185978 RepID=UPI00240604DA|nr:MULTISPECIES: GNAT family N-acetyltransferase [unclassified Paenibacillus]MDF9847550.1 ribosomal protein S18 acetylase RimI-like enzyme [Paenibacillus sp. PastM-2]MDH6507118.1 ribosomal protein S18 acetylase RimI-like enzyme [Paenibacillus sp. PastM-3]
MNHISKPEVRHELPSVEQYLALRAEAGLSPMSAAGAAAGLPRSCFAVTLYDSGQLVGMGRVIGDGGCFFQVTDIAVKPAYQGRGLGKAVMHEIRQFLDTVPQPSYVSLIADGEAARLYAQYGFAPVMPESQGMFLRWQSVDK